MDKCPNCGYCPHCKRGGAWIQPSPWTQPDVWRPPWRPPSFGPAYPQMGGGSSTISGSGWRLSQSH